MQSLPAQFDSWTLLSTDVTHATQCEEEVHCTTTFTLLKGPKVLLGTMMPFCSTAMLQLKQLQSGSAV